MTLAANGLVDEPQQLTWPVPELRIHSQVVLEMLADMYEPIASLESVQLISKLADRDNQPKDSDSRPLGASRSSASDSKSITGSMSSPASARFGRLRVQ